MEIKPPRSRRTSVVSSKESPATRFKPDKPCTTERASARPGLEKSAPTPLQRVASQFTKEDLRNPDKVDTVLRSAVDELILNSCSNVAAISEPGRRLLSDWLASDPIVRGRLRSYLEKILP
jgi:hypothetical protein